MMHKFRIFLSYAHADRGMVEQLETHLQLLGMNPIWDKEIPAGRAFDDVIRKRIAQAHVFMPLITVNSRGRPWVHQEIGYALGIGVPIVPVSVGTLPEGMLSGIQAIIVNDDLSGLRKGLEETRIESLVRSSGARGELERLGITTHVSEFSEERTMRLIRHAMVTHRPARVRQRALFSSFSLPDAEADNKVWDLIKSPGQCGDFLRTLLRDERRVLEEHARVGGCSLVLTPFLDFSSVGARVHRAQLEILREFLESMPADMITVAINDGKFSGNLTILGDWFGVKALPSQPGSEYRQTVFNHHAGTVLRWVEEFDREMEKHLQGRGINAYDSKDFAVKRIDERLHALPTA